MRIRTVAMFLCALGLPIAAHAGELWPELDVWLRSGQQTRVLFILTSVRSQGDRSDGEFDVYVDRRMSDFWSWRAGYVRLWDPDEGPTENRFVGDVTFRGKFGTRWLVADRVRADVRDLDGDASERLRNRFRIETAIRSLAPYLQGEAYYDTRFDAWTRARFELGVVVSVRSWLEIEPYAGWQEDSQPERDSTLGAGVIVTLKY